MTESLLNNLFLVNILFTIKANIQKYNIEQNYLSLQQNDKTNVVDRPIVTIVPFLGVSINVMRKTTSRYDVSKYY